MGRTDTDADVELEAALAASIADAAEQTGRFQIDEHREVTCTGGVLRQHSTLNQFHATFEDAISRHEAPRSICGYMTIAHCRLLRELLADSPYPLPLLALRKVGDALVSNIGRVLAEVERAMADIGERRRSYIEAHAADFPTDVAHRSYMRAWVANYEISDELSHDGFTTDCQFSWSSVPALHFARYNEYPQLATATHEERARIAADQGRFGGALDKTGVSSFGPNDSAYIFERFEDGNSSQLLKPNEWQNLEASQCTRVFAVDLNGHFVAAVAAQVLSEDGQPRPEVQIFNTTQGNYLDWPMLSVLHSVNFGGSATPALSTTPALEAEVVAMGFSATDAKSALISSGGDLRQAVEILLAQGHA